MTFWEGFIIGLIAGANLGIIVLGLFMGRRRSGVIENDLGSGEWMQWVEGERLKFKD